jgi:hypothetical protein
VSSALVSNYGLEVSAIPGSMAPSSFSVLRSFEGPQIVINWAEPSAAVDKVRLVRKKGSYPLNINDGATLLECFSGAQFKYCDRDVEHLTYYYYTLFTHEAATDTWGFSPKSMGKALALRTGKFERRLWHLTAPINRNMDKGA